MLRRALAAAITVLLACAAVACGTPTASRRAAPPAAPPAGGPDASRPDGASRRAREDGNRPDAADGSRSDPQPVYAPRVVVTPSGDAYLVLRSGPEQLDGGAAWHVLYLASGDPAELVGREAEDRLASAALDLAEAFRPLAELVQAEHCSVTALIGKPGGSGAIEQRAFARDAGPWHAAGAARRQAIEQVPAIAMDVVREPDQEASARDAAAGFLSDAVRADYDAAWARTSAIMKAVMSRTEFDRNLAALPLADGPGDGELYLSFPASSQRFLPGTFVEVWLAREAAERVGVQVLELRLDDDMEWRIAVVVNLTAAAASSRTPTALQDATRRTPHSPPEAARHSSR